ncbi:PhzF family phenazine biosynthesis protein [Mesorhizobium sp. PAMC28654]|uniref:PhzF family phenazine biosynthesis protein n=1 Tax=Mesorhizobium sp. PAMC28654 TaxID=2880934 RepID=UPI001D099EEC|nr:PhzF family phenazine biosynthesis protein [Mesorhizobium sp. PAMC28654]UDL91564.1 PhzF family phenazine biosynthesis protein [Mesorhizobium sp. PAMC28654]
MLRDIRLVSVFAAGPHGGNPAPIVVDAAGMSDADMQQVARSFGHESGFVLPPPPRSDCDFEFRFWVPNHEMSMCGHATVGALWLLDRLGKLPGDDLAIWTKSGRVDARIRNRTEHGAAVEISQPAGSVEPLPDADKSRADIIEILGIGADDLASLPIQNASTSRVKTLVPLNSVSVLDRLSPDFTRIEGLCSRIGSTGLYPYAVFDKDAQIVDARQFPRSSGYPEDAATGIAASALSFGLLSNGIAEASERQITIRQGRAMQRPSEILVRFRLDDGHPDGCWLGGAVRLEEDERVSS